MNRITDKNLDGLARRLNILTHSPETYMTMDGDKRTINVGHFHISHAYGGVCLQRTMNEGGGVYCPLWSGHIPKRDLYDQMYAYIRSIELGMDLVTET